MPSTDPIGVTSSERNPNHRNPKFLGGGSWLAPEANRLWKIIPAPLFDLDIPHQICHNLHQMRSLDTPPCATKPVSRRYSASDRHLKDDANTVKLRLIARLFALTPTEIGRAVGASRCYVSRIMSDNDPFLGSDSFYRKVESRIGDLIANRSTQFFQVNAVPVEDIRSLE